MSDFWIVGTKVFLMDDTSEAYRDVQGSADLLWNF